MPNKVVFNESYFKLAHTHYHNQTLFPSSASGLLLMEPMRFLLFEQNLADLLIGVFSALTEDPLTLLCFAGALRPHPEEALFQLGRIK